MFLKTCILFGLLYFVLGNVNGQSKTVPKNPKDTGIVKVDSLKAAIVTASTRPHIKGDTLEYNTEYLKVPPNAVVEDLLRRLPGLQIDPDGTITYNGEKIKRLLVDGEEIFSDDPTMVTRNFDASKIARVQVLERKTDQAIFTGVDDGTRTKTVNLVMKESAKDGYFGKVEAGGNTVGYYNANGALGGFRDKEQFTALGLASNTGVLGFQGNSGSSPTQLSFLNGNNDALGASAGSGIPRFNAAALHYANTWKGPGDHLTASYQYSHFYTEPITVMQSLQQVPANVYGEYQKSQSVNQQDQHWLYATYECVLSPAKAFRFTFHGSSTKAENQLGSSETNMLNDTLVNSSGRTIRDNVSRRNVGGDASCRITLGKRPERDFSANIGAVEIDNTTSGYLYAINHFYATAPGIDIVDQRKQISNHSLSIDGSLGFTEPLWTGTVLALSYGLFRMTDDPLQGTYARGDGKYQTIVDSLSSHFSTETISQRASINLQGKTRRLSYTIGTDWIAYDCHQKDLLADSSLRIKYMNFAPRVFLTYNPNTTTSILLRYNAVTQQPSVAQLTPMTNNSDPLNITLGNPNLKPGLNQNIHLDFHHFRAWLINVGLNMSLTSNNISTKTTIDSLGRQISEPVNVNGGGSGGINLSVARKLFGFDIGFHGAGNYTRTVNFVNADFSRNDAYTGGGGMSVDKFVADKYSLQLSTNFTYFDQVSSINTAAPVRYWTQTHNSSLTLYLIRWFEVNTNASYTWQEKTSAFGSATSVLLWNAYVSRNFLHNKLVAKFQFNNMLNANAGISRTNTGNLNSESSTNILGRYWMVSAIYHFDKKFKKK